MVPEGEVYANPQRCPQISLIDSRGVQVLHGARATRMTSRYRRD